MTLPKLMVAPNGARLSKSDHPNLPLSLDEVVEEAKACFEAGADGLHLHLRDTDGGHILDAGQYREAVSELANAAPALQIQITTEAVGMYDPAAQIYVAEHGGARFVSASIRELSRESDTEKLARFFERCAEAGVSLQHILYDDSDLRLLTELLPEKLLRSDSLQLLFVLGGHGVGAVGDPKALDPFLTGLKNLNIRPDWGVCAFGQPETECLVYALEQGGKLRVGFENSRLNSDGSVAASNAERVREVRTLTSRSVAA